MATSPYEKYIQSMQPNTQKFYNLGVQKRQNIEAQKERERRQREEEKERERRERERQKRNEEAKEAARKKRREKETQDALAEILGQTDTKNPPSTKQPSTKTKDEDDGGFFNDLFGDIGKSVGTGLKGGFEALNPFDDVGFKEGIGKTMGRQMQNINEETDSTKETKEFIDSVMEGASFGTLDSKGIEDEGASKVIGNLAGSLVPGAGIAGALRGTKLGAQYADDASRATKFGQRAKEGAAAGAIYGGADAGLGEMMNPDENSVKDHLGNILMETGFGAIADPAIGDLIDSLASRVSKGFINRAEAEKQVKEAAADAQERISLSREAGSQQRDLLAPEMRVPARDAIDNAFKDMQGLSQPSAPRTPNLDVSMRSDVSQEPFYNLGRQNQLMEAMDDMRTEPEFDPARLQRDMEQLNMLQENEAKQLEEFIKSNPEQQSLEGAIRETAESLENWKEIRDAKNVYKEINSRLGKNSVYVPDDHPDWKEQLPRHLRASQKGKRKSQDIYKAAEELGFESDNKGVEEMLGFINHYKDLANTKKKDIVPENSPDMSQLDEHETKIKEQFQKEIQRARGNKAGKSYEGSPVKIEAFHGTSASNFESISREGFRTLDADDPRKMYQDNIFGNDGIYLTLDSKEGWFDGSKARMPDYDKFAEVEANFDKPIIVKNDSDLRKLMDDNQDLLQPLRGGNYNKYDLEGYNEEAFFKGLKERGYDAVIINTDKKYEFDNYFKNKGEAIIDYSNDPEAANRQYQEWIDWLAENDVEQSLMMGNQVFAMRPEKLKMKGEAGDLESNSLGSIEELLPDEMFGELAANRQIMDELEKSINTPDFPAQTDEIQSLQELMDVPDKMDTVAKVETSATRKQDEKPLFNLGLTKAEAEAKRPKNPDGEIIDYGNREVGKTGQIDKGISRLMNQTLKNFSDSKIYIKRIENILYPNKTGIGKQKAGEFFRDAHLAHGAAGATEMMASKHFIPAIDDLVKAGRKAEDGFDYVYAKNLLETKAINPDYKFPNGLTEADLKAKVGKLESSQAVKTFANRMQQLNRSVLDMLQEAGYINEARVNFLKESYPNYMPKFRKDLLEDPDKMEDAFAKMFATGNSNPIQALKDGSGQKIGDPMENMIKYMLNANHAAFKNKALQHLSKFDGKKINGQTIARRIPETEKLSNTKYRTMVMVDGEPVHYELTPDLWKAINSMKGIMETDKVMDIFHRVSKVQGTAITGNPIFTVKQLVRDIPESWRNGQYSVIRDLPVAALDIFSNGKLTGNKSLMEEFMQSGAGMSTIAGYDKNKFYKAQKHINNFKYKDRYVKGKVSDLKRVLWDANIETLRNFNEKLENLPKLAQYRSTLRRTGDASQAAYEARDLMDFMNTGEVTQTLNRYARFVNANIRGKEKFLRATAERPFQTIGKTFVIGAIPSLAAHQLYNTMTEDQKNLVDYAPQWLEDTYWLLPASNGKDLVRIPKPYEAAAAVSTPLEWLLKKERKGEIDFEEERNNWMKEAFMIDMSLNPLTPLYEHATGKSLFRGTDIVPQREQNKDPQDQRDVYSSSLGQGIADTVAKIPGMNQTKLASPRNIDHLLDSYAPVSGENITDFFDRIGEVTGARENVKPAGTAGLEQLNPFKQRHDGTTSDAISNIYDTQADLQKRKSQMNESGQPFDLSRVYSMMNKAQDNDGEFAAIIREIDNDPNLSREEKQAERQKILDQRNQAAVGMGDNGWFSKDQDILTNLEESLVGVVDRQEDNTDKMITASLQKRGVPAHLIRQVMDMDFESEDEKYNALMTLAQNY